MQKMKYSLKKEFLKQIASSGVGVDFVTETDFFSIVTFSATFAGADSVI